MTAQRMATVQSLANQLRVDSIRVAGAAGSGHPTSSLSAADLLAVLLARHLRYDWQDPGHRGNDRLIFSKGHASPLLYAVFKAAGVVTDEELMDTYRRFGSRLEGHPTPVLPWVDVATGSLGQGLPIGVGLALSAKQLEHLPYHVWVLCGDSEMAEGSIWEALDKAGTHRLTNLTAIVDVNRLGQTRETELGWDIDGYRRRVEAFGCRAVPVDGHDLAAIDRAFTEARAADRPTVVLAHTVKGKGVPEVENQNGWHGKPLPQDIADRAIAALGGVTGIRVDTPRPEPVPDVPTPPRPSITLPRYEVGTKVATRKAYGEALAAIGHRPEVVALDGEVSNSTYAELFAKAHPDRYLEMFIAEQQMIATAVALSTRGYQPFASTFAAFLSRGYDFIRMAAISRASIRLCGSHAGVEIGEDGPSQMGLEDIAALRAVPGSTVLSPADATSCAYLVQELLDRDGVAYLRTIRGAHPVLYGPDERFPIGGSKLLRHTDHDRVALLGTGITVHTCLAAADMLARDGIPARVIDLYSVKPIDRDTLADADAVTGGRLVVAEDHHPEGGLGSAVLEALADQPRARTVRLLAVRTILGSGKPDEQLAAAGIDADAIAAAARPLADERT